MNSRSLFWAAMICVAGIILGILAGCASQQQLPIDDVPPPIPAPTPAPVVDEDIWTLLAKGETEKAMSLFFSSRMGVNETDSQGRTPLHYAAENKDPALAAFFLALGANVNAIDKDQRTPLAISAEKLDAPTAKILADAKANIHFPMKNSNTPARIAILENGDLLSALLNNVSLSSVDSSGRTILHIAAELGNIAAVNTILRAGNTPFVKDNQGKTALDIVLERTEAGEYAAVAERLILAGAASEKPIFSYLAPAVKDSNYNLRSDDGMAPLHYMAREGYIGYLDFALERGADVNIKNASGESPLHEATRSGNLAIIRKLLENKAEIDAQDAKGNSVLHLHIDGPPETTAAVIDLFLSRGADPNIRDEHGDSPLHIAMLLNKSDEVVRALLSAGADVTIRNLDGKTPLYLAVEKNRADKIPLLLNNKADIFAVDNNGVTPFEEALRKNPHLVFSMITKETVLQNDSNGNTILHLTVREGGDIAIVNSILDRNPLVANARNREGDTSLTIAVRKNNEAAGTLLLSRGADIFAVNARGESPLSLTFPPSNSRTTDFRRWMINPQTLSARDGVGNTVLHYAAQWKLDYWIPLLIDMKAATEAINATGETPLFFAARYNSPSTIRLLVTNGASLAARDFLGNSVLHAAVRWDAIQGAQTIIDLGLDVNCHALNGKTPLHDSIRWRMPEMQALLIKSKADIELRDKDGNTAFMEAVMAGDPVSMEMLAKLGADTKTRNFKGDTALHVSADIGRIDLSTQLLTWGVSIHARNAQDRTPFQIALKSSTRLVRTFLTRDRINSSDDFGYSPLHIAIQEKADAALIKTILELGARQNSVDQDGRTPLRLALDLNLLDTAALLANSESDVFYAARDGKTPAEISLAGGEAMVKALFSGNSIKAKDSSGNTVLHYAARHGDPVMVSLLLSLGAQKEIKNIASESPAEIAMRWRHPEAAALLY